MINKRDDDTEDLFENEHLLLRLDHLESLVGFKQLSDELKEMGDLDGAISCYGQAIEMVTTNEPFNYELLAKLNNNMGTLWVRKGDDQAAVQFFQKAIDYILKSDNPFDESLAIYHANKGYSLNALKDFNSSLNCFQKYLEVKSSRTSDPKELQRPHFDLGVIYYKLNQFELAAHHFNFALQVQKTIPIAKFLAECHEGMSNYENAIMHYLEMLEMSRSTELQNNLKNVTKSKVIQLAQEHNMQKMIPGWFYDT